MLRSKRVPVVLQMSAADCGAACLAMVVRYWGGSTTVDACQRAMGGGAQGVTALMLAQSARTLGIDVQAFRHTPQGLAQVQLPAIVHWQGVHFVVLEAWGTDDVQIVDPAVGRRTLTAKEFAAGYSGVTLVLKPGVAFAAKVGDRATSPVAATWRAYLRRIQRVPSSNVQFLQLLLASLLYQIAGLTLPTVTWLVVEKIVPSGNVQWLPWLASGMTVAVLAQAAITYLRAVLVIRLQQQLDSRLIPDFFAHLLRLPYPFFQQRTPGDLLARLEGNRAIRELILSGVLIGLLDGGLALLYLGILYSQSPLFGAIVTVTASAQFLLLAYSGERLHAQSQMVLATQAEEEGFVIQILRGIETIKVAGTESWLLAQWHTRFSAVLRASAARGYTGAQIQTLLQLLSQATPLLLLWIGVGAVTSGRLSLGQMLALVVLAVSTLVPLSNLADHLLRFQQIWAYLERQDDVWTTKPETETAPDQTVSGQIAVVLQGGIEVADLAFRYDQSRNFILQNLTFKVGPGEKVAIVGVTGSGKSTLVRLLLGLYPPTQGQITYDGYTVAEIGLARLRQSIGVVLQDSFILGGTIQENIALHQPEMPMTSVVAAAKIAALHEEITRLPMGYATRVGEGGSGLSGGQRQRLVLARAVATSPMILVLDEATSHLDSQTECMVQRALDGLSMTQLIIAHRLSTVRNADRILKLEAGRLVELDRQQFLAHYVRNNQPLESPISSERLDHQAEQGIKHS